MLIFRKLRSRNFCGGGVCGVSAFPEVVRAQKKTRGVAASSNFPKPNVSDLFRVEIRDLVEQVAVLFGRNLAVFFHLVYLDDVRRHIAESVQPLRRR